MAKTRIAHAVRVAILTSGAAFAGLCGAGVSAQEAVEVEEITVTGSRIRTEDLDTARPVLMITREAIENQGFAGTADILQNMTASGAPPLSRASPLSSGEAAGGQFVQLRGLNAQRTLILVDGYRLGITTGGLQDLSGIPTSMIERIEVLKDGASSVYGSDAIAGVVNIITRKDFQGIQFNGYASQYDEGDGTVQKYDFLLGHSSENGSITVGAEWAREEVVRARDRDFAAYPRGALLPDVSWTVAGQYGGWTSAPAQALPGVVYAGNTRVVLSDGGDPLDFADYRAQNVSSASTADKSNTNQQTDLRTPLERQTVFLNGSYDFAENLAFVGSASYSLRDAERTVAGYPYQAASFATFGTPMSVDSYFNPIGNHHGYATPTSITNWWRRTWEVPRVSTSEANALRFTAGLQGSFDVANRNFAWDAGYLYSNSTVMQTSYGNLNLLNVQRAVGPSFLNAQGQVQCGTAAAPISFGATADTCTPWNPFLAFGQVGDGGLTDNSALAAYLFQEEHSTGETETQIYSANITGPVLELPAGELSFATGVERREEKGQFIPDALSVVGGSTNLSARPTEGGYELNEIYAEVLVPILADVTMAETLNVTLATRYSDFSTFGDTTNSKAGLEWRPLEQLLFRATWAEGFRAPTISNLYAGGSQTFAFYTDPCDPVYGVTASDPAAAARCDADIADFANFRQLQQGFVPAVQSNAQTPVAFFANAANPLLEPEESVSKTAGIVWTPEQILSGLQVSLDWWTVRIENTIVTDTPNLILNDCYVQGVTSRCGLFTRDAALGYVNTMNYGFRNAGYRYVEGYDLDLLYTFDTRLGEFTVSSRTTYLTDDELKSTNDAVVVPTENIGFADSSGTTHEVRSIAGLEWSLDNWGVTWNVRYYSGLTEACLSNVSFPQYCSDPQTPGPIPTTLRDNNELDSDMFHDVQVRWNAPWEAVIAFGANNVFEHLGDPMYSQPNANVSYNGEFDIGRALYLRYQQNW